MHGNAQWTMSIALFGGNTVVLSTEPRFDADEIWDLVEREGVLVISLVGDAMARPLVDALARRDQLPPTVFAIVSGGAILSPSIKAEINEKLPNVIVMDAFGASETGANGAVDMTDKGPRFRMNEWTTVITDDGKIAHRSARSACSRGGATCRSATTRTRQKTAATFVEFDGVRWAIPGDRAVIEDDGTITVLGRGSQCINTGGEKVFPEEVEAVLKSHPDVFDAIVVGVPDDALRRSGRGRGRAARGQARRRSTSSYTHARTALGGLQAAEAPRARRRGRAHARRQAELPLGEGARDFRVTLAATTAGAARASPPHRSSRDGGPATRERAGPERPGTRATSANPVERAASRRS